MKLLISGAGIGGLALAAFLQDTGIECLLIEKARDWDHQGFSIGLWSNGRAMLQKLGTSDKLDKLGIPLRSMSICTGNGKVLRAYDLEQFRIAYGSGDTHVKRADLHQWLLEAAGNPNIRMGTTITSMNEQDNGMLVTLSDGTEVQVDVVVGADGVHSPVRTQWFGTDCAYTGWRSWYTWIPGSFEKPHTVTEFLEPGASIVLFNEGKQTLAFLVAKADHTVWDTEEGRIDRLKELFKCETCIVPALFEGKINNDFLPTDLATVHLKDWYKGRVVLLGDAAHAFPPFAALGASMALEDAYILAGELLQNNGNHAEAFARYQAKRQHRVAQATRLTDRMRLWTTIESPLLRKLVNAAVPFVPEFLFTKQYAALLSQTL